MTLNGCHGQLCAREVFPPRQPLPCGLAGSCASVIEVARTLLFLWSAAVTGFLFPSVTRSPVSVVLAALSPMRRARLVPFVSVLVAHLVRALLVPLFGLR